MNIACMSIDVVVDTGFGGMVISYSRGQHRCESGSDFFRRLSFHVVPQFETGTRFEDRVTVR
ncbi:hypothetical protein H351_08505 [Rhodococcus erythropolis R138]|nr:hypothetical protein H351_08505 [Rhodococcus erythropolis R138]